mmetsp:Transcript_26289/g.78076  ORF Transcript_26289/g.78076 Transcript_26289/m.78076 type:complete len:292 (-) Transcript_26289:191-1066(-)
MQWISSVLSPDRTGPLAALGLGNATSMSGAGASPDGRSSFGFALMRGKRPGMEDFHHAEYRKDTRSGETVGLFGVFDGHGGPNAADFVRSNLFKNLLQHPKWPGDIQRAIAESFTITDNQYLRSESDPNREDGSTGVAVILYQGRLIVANVGDSRGVLSRAGQAVTMTVDHKPNNKDEKERIENAGGVVIWAGTWRVGGVLAVSRAFGDKPLKQFVISTPHVREDMLSRDDEFLILASDGVWDVINNEDSIALIRDIKDEPEKAAKRLAEEAYSRGSCDNISCIVIRFKYH